MTNERDFSTVTFKVNTAGSWANLVTCIVERIDAVKAACETLAMCGRVKFKFVDEDGGTIEEYRRDRYGNFGWHAPKR